AVNLDGGGSSAVSVRIPGYASCTLQNRPSDGSSRKCGAYMLYVTDKVSDGKVKYLAVQNDGPVVLAGSSVTLSYLGADGGFRPAPVPGDIKAVSGGLGTVAGTTYKAGPVRGADRVTLSSPSTGASGYGTIHVIKDPTDLKVTANGAAVPAAGLTVWPGDTVQLNASAFYYGLPVASDPTAVKYAAGGDDIGMITGGGIFTAGFSSGASGALSVAIGGKSVSIPVTVTGFNDVAPDHWAKTSIKGLTERGVITGTTPVTFEPDKTIRRGDFVLMLWRAAGKPAAETPASFADVMPEEYYAAAVAWAESAGIARGDGTGLFRPTDTLTREQAFTLLYRALDDLNIPYTDALPDVLGAFNDRDMLSDYAITPTATLVSMGVVSGAYGNLLPADAITRAGMAKILYEAMN
ncbi:MAG: S-layer homology domain-containing protein, partial [Clostridiales bacterium]|nr:S-layer homology domain-containing protein [Clostridiales bacterium]